jgi:uncharacterized protein
MLSLGEAKWDKDHGVPATSSGCVGARDLLAVKGYDTEQTRLTCYSGARFDAELADRAAGDPLIQLVGLEELYA